MIKGTVFRTVFRKDDRYAILTEYNLFRYETVVTVIIRGNCDGQRVLI